MAIKKPAPKKKVATPAKSAKKKDTSENKKPEPNKKEPAIKPVRVKLLAELYGVTDRRIQQFCEEGVITPLGPKDKDGYQFDFARAIVAIGRKYREMADNKKSNESKDLESAKLEEKKIKIEKYSLELEELKKDLHRSADIERVVGAAMSRLRINLRGIPMGVAALIKDLDNENEIAELIMERIDRALSEVADINIDDMMDKEEGAYSE